MGVNEQFKNSRPGGLDIAPVVLVHLIHLAVKLEVRQEDVDLNDVIEAGAGLLEDGTEVADDLMLSGVLAQRVHVADAWTYSVSLNIAINDLSGLGIHGESTRGEDEAIGDDGLVHEIGRGGRGLLGGDGCPGHFSIGD